MSEQTVTRDVVVALEYTLYDTEGQVLDSSAQSEPIEFLQGRGQVLSGLEDALYGMEVGQEKEVTLEPRQAYGERQEGATEQVPRSTFPQGHELQEGMPVRLRDEGGRELTAYVAEVGDEEVLLDMNHPLAGESLRFEVKVVSLRQPTGEELEHGHAHGGGHHH